MTSFPCFLCLADIFPMRIFYIGFIDHGIMHGRVNSYMPQQALHLFHRHAFIDCHGGKCPAEFMWMYIFHMCFLTNLL